jgi:hypothetical protein
MKKLINGRRYDTDTAKELACWDNGVYGDINSVEETLYRKNTGEFFLHGSGGANTKYARSTGTGNWTPGEEIIPLTLEAAQEWAEKFLSVEKYEEIFGVTEEDSQKKLANFSLSLAAIEKIARLADEKKVAKSEIIERLVMEA